MTDMPIPTVTSWIQKLPTLLLTTMASDILYFFIFLCFIQSKLATRFRVCFRGP
jgi:hypothetical protein